MSCKARTRISAAGAVALALFVLAGCAESEPPGCADPGILDQMRRESLFVPSAARVRLTAPEFISAQAGALNCQATWHAEGTFAALVPVLEFGYPFTRAPARAAFDMATGLPPGQIEAAGRYLRERAAAGGEPGKTTALSGPVRYRVTRAQAPFLLDWQFQNTAIAAHAGRRFAASLQAERAAERAEKLALARSRGFASVAAMRAAYAEARAARARLREIRQARNKTAGQLQQLKSQREDLRQAQEDSAVALTEFQNSAQSRRARADRWTQRIKRESFAQDNDRLEFSDTRVYSGASSFGSREQAVVAEVVSFSDQTYYSADFYVVVWHEALQRFFEDRSMHADFGRDGLSPGESRTLRISLNGKPGIGLAFTGKGFRTPGTRHAFLFVNALADHGGNVLFRDQWRSPAAARADAKGKLASLRAARAERQQRLAELTREINNRRGTLLRLERELARLRDTLPPLPADADTGDT